MAENNRASLPLTPTEPRSPALSRQESQDELEDNATILLQRWLQSYRCLPSSVRRSALVALVDELKQSADDHQHLPLLRHAAALALKRDFIRSLPEEVAVNILARLDGRSLLACCQVSTAWRRIATRDILWQPLYRTNFPDSTLIQELTGRTILDPVRSSWRKMYLTKQRVQHAWHHHPPRQQPSLHGHTGVITCMCHAGADTILTGSDDGTLRVWSLSRHECLRTLSGHHSGVWCCDVEGDYVVSGACDRTVRVWSLSSGRCYHTLYGHTSTVRCVRLRNGIAVTGSRDHSIRMWNVRDGTLLRALEGHTETVRCIDMDEEVVVSGSYDCTVRIWSVSTGECLHCLEGHNGRIYSMQYDGVHVATGSLDFTIGVWDAKTGLVKFMLQGHTSLTGVLRLSGNLLVSGNADTTIRVWDINTGTCLHVMYGHQSAITSLSLQDNVLISCGDDGLVILRNIHTGSTIRVALNARQEANANNAVVWLVASTDTKLVCAVGSRPPNSGHTHLDVLDFKPYTQGWPGSSIETVV